jgi:phosphoglycolate phosphatase-like HAD superfamily hydrolase
MKNTDTGWLFLDFDGVLCDSLEECFQSSWLALNDMVITDEVPPRGPQDEAYRRRFLACRPYIRSGEDYLVLHQLVERSEVPTSQAEFDLQLAIVGRGALEGMKTRLYRVREDLLARHRSLWLSWNPLFPGIATLLGGLLRSSKVWILSTKKASFIAEILAFHKVDWPLGRIQYSGSRRKLDWIAELAPGQPALLVDDQVDHLDFEHPLCACRLALWGYVTPKSLENNPPAVTLETLPTLLEPWRG